MPKVIGNALLLINCPQFFAHASMFSRRDSGLREGASFATAWSSAKSELLSDPWHGVGEEDEWSNGDVGISGHCEIRNRTEDYNKWFVDVGESKSRAWFNLDVEADKLIMIVRGHFLDGERSYWRDCGIQCLQTGTNCSLPQYDKWHILADITEYKGNSNKLFEFHWNAPYDTPEILQPPLPPNNVNHTGVFSVYATHNNWHDIRILRVTE